MFNEKYVNVEEISKLASINEVALYTSRGGKKNSLSYCIHADPDQHRLDGYFGDPYIKIGDNISWDKAKRSIRISMKTGKPINSHRDGKQDLSFDSSLRDFLNDAMQSDSSYDPKLTVYNAFYQFLEDNYSWHDKYKELKKKGTIPYACPTF